MTVFELQRGDGSVIDLCVSLEVAKRRAQEILDEYVEFYRKFSAEELEDTEPLDVTVLEWKNEHHRFGRDPRMVDPTPYPTAHYSEHGVFRIKERKVVE